jgi:hypothetical protein
LHRAKIGPRRPKPRPAAQNVRVSPAPGIDEHEQRHWLTNFGGHHLRAGRVGGLGRGHLDRLSGAFEHIANHLPEYATLKARL